MSLNTKLASLKQLETVLTVKEVNLPENSADPLALFESNSSARASTANEWIIDVFPSQIPIFTYIHKLAAHANGLANHKDHAKSSLATIAMYYVTIFQAFFLLNDLHVRPTPSQHASSWLNTSYKSAFATWLLTLPVPESMILLFEQLYAATTDKTNNIFFVPSAAGFNLHHHFGRFVPVNFYAHIHDTIATLPGNSRPADVWKDLLPKDLFTLYANATTTKTSVTVADILGISATGTTAHYCASKWYQSFNSIFTPVLFRDFQRRSQLATLDLAVPSIPDAARLNAYDILFGATPSSLRELKIVLQDIAGILTSTVPCKKTLSQVLAATSGTNILQHGYSDYALPTWLANIDTVKTTFDAITAIRPVQPTTRATNLKFLVNPTRPAATTTIVAAAATNDDGTGTGLINRINFPWSLVSGIPAATPVPQDDRDFVLFSDQEHTFPRVLVLDTTGRSTVSAHLATLTGKIIESFEIDGTTIPHPDIRRSLASQNCLFADSAIPYRYCARAIRHRTDNANETVVLRRFLPKPSTSQQAATLLHNRTEIRLPHISGSATIGEGEILDSTAPTSIPGMTTYANSNWLKYVQSFFGFTTKINTNGTSPDFVPSTDPGRLVVWSPYTYTSYIDNDQAEMYPDLSLDRTYFITNLRSIFGTDVNLVEVLHPMEAMPA